MAADAFWLVFDLGTSGVKAAIMTSGGAIVRSTVVNYPTMTGAGGVIEQNADDWWQALVTATRALAPDLERVTAISITGQMQDLIVVNAKGDALLPVILYSDTRASAEAAEIAQRIGHERLLAIAGSDLNADSLLAKCLWLLRHRPDALGQAAFLLFGAADYAAFKMTGTAAVDTTTASTTGLIHLRSKHWLDRGVLHDAGIDAVIPLLPLLVIGGAMVGRLAINPASALGLKPGIPVYHAPGDAGAATVGAGCGESGAAYGYLGTSGWIAFTAAKPGPADHGVITLAHPRPDHYIQVAPLLTAGGNLEWICELFGVADYDQAITASLATPITDLLYLPYLNGERAPIRDPLARAAFIGINRRTEPIDLCRAVLEGVVYAYRHALDTLLPSPPAALMLTGGGARSASWGQLFADVLGVPITLAADPEFVALRGALLASQVARGSFESYAPDGYFPAALTLLPKAASRYDQKYRQFRAAYPALKPVFVGLSNGHVAQPAALYS